MSTPTPGPTRDSRWPQRIVLVLVAAVIFPVGASILYHNAPTERVGIARFYPGCMFHALTGLHCPGCGATRALHALLHLDLAQAFAWNPLFVICVPLIAYSLYRIAYSAWTGVKAPGPNLQRVSGGALLVIVLVFWIARNVPVPETHFNPLAPHPIRPSDPPAPRQSPTP